MKVIAYKNLLSNELTVNGQNKETLVSEESMETENVKNCGNRAVYAFFMA